jgi:DNA polymerase III alpha subunit
MYLNCHSYFSLRYGTLSLEKLVEEAVKYHVPALALTDINNSTGIMDFVKICKEKGIKPIAGIEFRKGDELLYIGLAKNNEGFRELNEFLTHYTLCNQQLPDRMPEFENVAVIYPLRTGELVNWRTEDKNKTHHLTTSPPHHLPSSPVSPNTRIN